MDCPIGGFPSKHYYLICDITANLMTEVCNGLVWDLLRGEQVSYASAITDDSARSDIFAQGLL